MKTLTVLTIAIVFAPISLADDKARIDELQKEIAELKTRLADKEQELGKLLPVENVKWLYPATMKTGTAGYFAHLRNINGQRSDAKTGLKVERIIDANRMFCSVLDSSGPLFMVVGYSQKDLVDGSVISDPPMFKVNGTEKTKSLTYFVVEPYTTPKK
jgi:hypothetical protein